MKKTFIIDNCEFKVKYKCPQLWKDLQGTDNPDARYCNECEKEVYRCNDEKEVKKHIELKHCIATEGNFIDNEPSKSKVMQELTDALKHLEDFIENFGNEKTEQIVKQLNDQAIIVIEKQDLKTAKGLIQQINKFSFDIVEQGTGVALAIGSIKDFDDNFYMHDWKNRSQARELINDAIGIINANRATKQNLNPISVQLFGLLDVPQSEPLIGVIEDY